MFVDRNDPDEAFNVEIDIVLPHIPCQLLSLDAEDIMGNHIEDLHGTLEKVRLSKGGQALAKEAALQGAPASSETALEALKNQEGCQLVGGFKLRKVPGNFHISTHASSSYSRILENHELDFSHNVNYLYFGDKAQIDALCGQFENVDAIQIISSHSRGRSVSKDYVYYLSLVPAVYEDRLGRAVKAYQFKHSLEVVDFPAAAVVFRYDISAITIKYSKRRRELLHFAATVGAILAGVYKLSQLLYRLLRSLASARASQALRM